MLHETAIVLTAFVYLGVLFAIAYYADERADAGRSVIASPYIYSLSLAVSATAWTFYGSVGETTRDAGAARGRRRRLRELGLAYDPLDDGDHVPATPVSGRGGRKPR